MFVHNLGSVLALLGIGSIFFGLGIKAKTEVLHRLLHQHKDLNRSHVVIPVAVGMFLLLFGYLLNYDAMRLHISFFIVALVSGFLGSQQVKVENE